MTSTNNKVDTDSAEAPDKGVGCGALVRRPGWFVVDGNRDNKRLRGPYAHEETAGAVRAEMERGSDYDHCNLWVEHRGEAAPDDATEGKALVAHLVKAWGRDDDRTLCHWTNKLREWAGIPA